MTEVLTDTQPIRLKGRSFLALVLTPELPFSDWLTRLDSLAARSAGFFLRRPIVLDIAGIDIDREQLRDLLDQLGEREIRIMGIEGGRPSQLGSDIPPAMAGGLPASDLDAPGTDAPIAIVDGEIGNDADKPAPSLMVTQPVRSGQSLMSEGDITIVGSVASGAEVVAGGSVHVYGTVRGRIAAGTTGNTSARIFCRKLEAELVAIAGFYKTSDDFEHELRGQAVQLWLDNDSLLAEKLG
ncbi:septum site-determining protein MinC [Hoeflea prorocentri]|uniref:Probable septum site-determining protein MinC n=1 Tax=Hoeflea prorocentri TaxID=1922333 RepID=A0A9X3UJ37_9HYPH|nr:septum site-determining protein MinC [Hoeflea prorocentri]MCY6381773.1 septum site-determining protein MinC [Hoeflea prorocentri]MDA5399573.1 septum site-determining protein MinC [Hoeflea prorocentri]